MARAIVLGILLAVTVPPVLADPPDVTGVIVQVDREHARLHVRALDAEHHWIACDEETIVTIDGATARFSDLHRDLLVEIQLDPDTEMATRVDATTLGARR
jgi:hypothetical protein